MSKAELFNWFLFALAALAALAVYMAYRKSYEVIQPPRKPIGAFSPDQYKLAFETVELSTADGVRLKGWFIPAPGGESGRTIILCHGRGSNRGELLRAAEAMLPECEQIVGKHIGTIPFIGWPGVALQQGGGEIGVETGTPSAPTFLDRLAQQYIESQADKSDGKGKGD